MKKRMAVFPIAALVLVLVGCSSDGKNTAKATAPAQQTQQQSEIVADDPELQDLADAFIGTADLLLTDATIKSSNVSLSSGIPSGSCNMSYREPAKSDDSLRNIRRKSVSMGITNTKLDSLCTSEAIKSRPKEDIHESVVIGNKIYVSNDGEKYISSTMTDSFAKQMTPSSDRTRMLTTLSAIVNNGKIKKVSDDTYTMTIESNDDLTKLGFFSGGTGENDQESYEELKSISGVATIKIDGSVISSVHAKFSMDRFGTEIESESLITYDTSSTQPEFSVPKYVTPGKKATVDSSADMTFLYN